MAGNENSKPGGGCPALHPSEQIFDNLVVEPSPWSLLAVFLYIVLASLLYFGMFGIIVVISGSCHVGSLS